VEIWHFGEPSNPCKRRNTDVKPVMMIDDNDEDFIWLIYFVSLVYVALIFMPGNVAGCLSLCFEFYHLTNWHIHVILNVVS
jgi:hypothetical protein